VTLPGERAADATRSAVSCGVAAGSGERAVSAFHSVDLDLNLRELPIRHVFAGRRRALPTGRLRT
jgi:hypothetical protein